MAMEVGRSFLDISFKAIDAYKKTLLVDKVTSNDDQPPPVYVLNDLSDILRSCSSDLTQEIVEYTFRRLRHPNPHVKHKVLRFIKYTVNRAGSAVYRRELQRNAASIRELFNFQGQADPFKGNIINEAVRDAAHEAIKAIFSYDSSQPTSNNISNRIEGFGSGNFSEYVRSSHQITVSEDIERGRLEYHGGDGYVEEDGERDSQRIRKDKPKKRENEKVSSPEEELLHRITASQGLRLQPTHESLQSFLSTAKTLDAVKICLSLEAKLRSQSWQVQLKALCVLQALLGHNDARLLQAIAEDEAVFRDCVQECLSSSQTTLRKRANEVLKSLRAAKKAKDLYGKPDMLADDNTLTKTKSLDMDFFTLEPNNSKDGEPSVVSPFPATAHIDQLGDLLSLQEDDTTEAQAVETSPNSVMDDPFKGMSVYGSKGSQVEDLLTGEYMDYGVHSKGSMADFQNLNALYNIGSPYNIATLQRPVGTHCFERGINSGNASFNGKIGSGRHALGDNYFKEFGLSS